VDLAVSGRAICPHNAREKKLLLEIIFFDDDLTTDGTFSQRRFDVFDWRARRLVLAGASSADGGARQNGLACRRRGGGHGSAVSRRRRWRRCGRGPFRLHRRRRRRRRHQRRRRGRKVLNAGRGGPAKQAKYKRLAQHRESGSGGNALPETSEARAKFWKTAFLFLLLATEWPTPSKGPKCNNERRRLSQQDLSFLPSPPFPGVPSLPVIASHSLSVRKNRYDQCCPRRRLAHRKREGVAFLSFRKATFLPQRDS